MRTDAEKKARANVIYKMAQAAGLTVTTTETPEGVAYSLVDNEGEVHFRFGPEAAVIADNSENGIDPDDFISQAMQAGDKRREQKEGEPVNNLSH